MLTSYLEGQLSEYSALFGVERSIASLREAIEEHGRKIIITGIEDFAAGRDITPAIRAEAIGMMIDVEPKHSPYRGAITISTVFYDANE